MLAEVLALPGLRRRSLQREKRETRNERRETKNLIMKSLLYRDFDLMEFTDQPKPSIKPDEVLVKVAAVGICGSELDSFRQKSPRRPPPLIMGHEFCGIIEQIGSEVRALELGQRVVSNALVPDSWSREAARGNPHLSRRRQVFGMHRPGAFAEYVPVPASCLIDWPNSLAAEAACLAEPLGNGIHVCNLTSHLQPKRVLVIGAGPIGLMCQQAFQLTGATVLVSDPNKTRAETARQLGARRVIVPPGDDVAGICLAETDGEGADVVVDAYGSGETKRLSLQCTRPGGAAVWIGLHENKIELDSFELTLPERAVFGTYGAKLEELREAVRLMTEGKVDVSSWVTVLPLDRGVDAFDRMLRGTGRDIKAVLVP